MTATTAHRFSRLLLVTLGALIAALAAPTSGRATTFSADSVVSASGSTLAADAYEPVISGDGDDVVWVGMLKGIQGVWETSLSTGAVAPVAGASSTPAINAPDAGSPSVSANGQYVVFTTTADLDPVDDPGNGCSSVYVRNMDVPASQPGAYVLASALNGSAAGITYTGTASSGCPGGGSAAAGKVAISANGNEVAFTVIGGSDLTTGVPTTLTTPPDQVALRSLDSDTTTLVSQTAASEQAGMTPVPVPDGAALTYTGTQSGAGTSAPSSSQVTDSVLINGTQVTAPIDASTAAISADGSTVAWMGIDIPAQAAADPTADAASAYPDQFDEPLWRDVAAGPGSPTLRITGGDDPAAPNGQGPFAENLNPGSAGDAGPDDGTLIQPSGFGTFDAPTVTFGESMLPLDEATPQLSANGQEVAFLADVYENGDVPTGSGLNRPTYADGMLDAYVVNMASGLTRVAALSRLSEVAEYPVEDLAISADGTKVAFTTADTAFPLSSPALITPSLTQVSATQLYEADLTAGTISLVSYGYDGNPADGDVLAPSFTTDGNTLAFASAADNLVYGAYNGTSSNAPSTTLVFTTAENVSSTVVGQTSIGPGLSPVAITPEPALSAIARAERNGSVILDLDVPGAGTITARGTALITGTKTVERVETVKVRVKVTPKPRRKRGKSTTQIRLKTERKRVKITQRVDAIKTIASARRTSTGSGDTTLTLTPSRAYAAELERASGLYTTLAVSFAAAGQTTLHQTLQITLHEVKPAVKQTVVRR